MSNLITAGTAAVSLAHQDWQLPPTILIEYTEVKFDVTPPGEVSPNNRAAAALLGSWRNEDEQEQRTVWETLQQTLDKDRLSSRERIS